MQVVQFLPNKLGAPKIDNGWIFLPDSMSVTTFLREGEFEFLERHKVLLFSQPREDLSRGISANTP